MISNEKSPVPKVAGTGLGGPYRSVVVVSLSTKLTLIVVRAILWNREKQSQHSLYRFTERQEKLLITHSTSPPLVLA
jgi:hypothetical protein